MFMTETNIEQPPYFHQWSYTVETDETSIVLPDGCTDIIVISNDESEISGLHSTSWDISPRRVRLRAGTSLTGFRLRPGATIDLRDLGTEAHSAANLAAQISSVVRHDQEITQIIDDIGLPGRSVAELAKQQGVSERTLQRHFKGLSLPSLGFWRQLGRARRAVQALPCRVPLTEIALEYGYSDQAHMTREFVRWFGKTPVQLRRDHATLKDLAQPGLGNWSSQAVL